MHDAEAAIQIIVPRVRELASALAIRARFAAPRVVDLWTFAPVRAVLERPLEDGRDTVTAHSFADALDNCAAVDAHARYMRTAALVEALRAEAAVRAAVTLPRSPKAASILAALRASDMPPDDAAPPASAITFAMNWFGCSWCKPHSPRARVRTGPEALSHRCNIVQPPACTDWHASASNIYARFRIACGRVAGSGECGTPWVNPTARDKALYLLLL
jgi:hypothetical protein